MGGNKNTASLRRGGGGGVFFRIFTIPSYTGSFGKQMEN